METLKVYADIDEARKVMIDLPSDIPVGKAEILIIVQPMSSDNGKKGVVDLAERGITPQQAADMRNRVISFEEDWNAPGMEAYDEL